MGGEVSVGPQRVRSSQSYVVTVRNVTRGGSVIAAEGIVVF
jgi:hypothetical protein